MMSSKSKSILINIQAIYTLDNPLNFFSSDFISAYIIKKKQATSEEEFQLMEEGWKKQEEL